ncbi:MAG: DUF1428 family protein [Paracoccaceae bacterium]
MTYVTGSVCAVEAGRKDEFTRFSKDFAKLAAEFGATRCIDCWGEDVPHGRQTDFYRAVDAKEGEVVVFSWMEFPSKQVADTAMQQMMDDPRMAALGQMPFDGKRMIYGGFSPVSGE